MATTSSSASVPRHSSGGTVAAAASAWKSFALALASIDGNLGMGKLVESWPAPKAVAPPGTKNSSQAPEVRLTHIPKTAGITLDREVRALNYTLRSKDAWDNEQCYPVWRHPTAVNMVMLRSPRDHVVSMFLECRYHHGLRVGLGGNPYFQAKIAPHNDTEAGLVAWLSTFLAGNPHSLVCYDPRNLQTRALSCNARDPGASHRFTRNTSLIVALRNLHTVDVVGTTEAFHESLCLLRYRVDGALPADCCREQKPAAVPHVSKHDRWKLAASTLSAEAAAWADAATSLDRELHAVATGLVQQRFATALVRAERSGQCAPSSGTRRVLEELPAGLSR
jgi:hypothetical protein